MSKEINKDGYRLAHTMIRVRDLEASFNFYCKTLGMKILRKTDYPDGRFTNVFIGYGLETESPTLELTHNWDQKENYDKGNGWGHICIETPNVYKAIWVFTECNNSCAMLHRSGWTSNFDTFSVKIFASYKVELNEKIELTK